METFKGRDFVTLFHGDRDLGGTIAPRAVAGIFSSYSLVFARMSDGDNRSNSASIPKIKNGLTVDSRVKGIFGASRK
jgi:hypothetical protein